MARQYAFMLSNYLESEAEAFVARHAGAPRELALCAYVSRLLGADPALVLHGGGNSSVKLTEPNLFGEPVEWLLVKGSGHDMAAIEPEGFAAVDLAWARRLRGLDTLSDEEMMRELATRPRGGRAGSLPASLRPSVETLLHAFLPHRHIVHTHAESILVLTNQADGAALAREALGEDAAWLPYVRPGLPLARAAASLYESNRSVAGLILAHHGLVTFADDARAAYERTIELVDRAERFIGARAGAGAGAGIGAAPAISEPDPARLAAFAVTLRGVLSRASGGGRYILEIRSSPELLAAAEPESAAFIAASGVLTPDHVLRVGYAPLVLEDLPETDEELASAVTGAVRAYRERAAARFERESRARGMHGAMLDPNPRVILAPGIGLIAAGGTREEARAAADIAGRTVHAKLLAARIGQYEPLADADIFEIEYWGLEQRKLAADSPGLASSSPLRGQVALVTGGGGAVALGIADRLLAAGAVVALADIDASKLARVRDRLATAHPPCRIETLVMDVADEAAVSRGFDHLAARAGGIDLVVPNAGLAHVAPIESLAASDLRRLLEVNFLGVFTVLKAAARLFRRQGTGGNVVLVSTKNVFDPGASFGAYSASKAAAHQLARIAALEFAPLGVRVNMVSPDAVFGDEDVPSGLWETVGPDRARSRGMEPAELREYYRGRNLLKAEVRAEHVGNAVLFFATNRTPTTGATLPVDGGLPGAFPR